MTTLLTIFILGFTLGIIFALAWCFLLTACLRDHEQKLNALFDQSHLTAENSAIFHRRLVVLERVAQLPERVTWQ